MHTHAVDQIFYILSGTMSLEIQSTSCTAGPEPKVHLAINAPLPDPRGEFPQPA
jgi:hypothetical protein